VIREQSAEFQFMVRKRVIIEIRFDASIPDTGTEADLEIILFGIEAEFIVVIQQCGIGEQTTIENVVPAHGGGGIAPGDIRFERALRVIEVENITPEITADEQTVLLGKPIVHFSVEIVEIISGTIETAGLLDKLFLSSGFHTYQHKSKYDGHDSSSAYIHPSSVLFSKNPDLFVCNKVVETSKPFALDCQTVKPE